ncbi:MULTISPECIES: hypothetical protein [Xanthomonas]|uniref:hypothetical protein n=1 Tax=Xanthomonas TaxID=338 RepID=UPI00040265BF|nr:MULTISPECIES: hypothetical protein [Xanthomonas]ATS66093.1 hypothetical protein XcfCFBP4885P_22830 [Xanthomonas citri pv. phaseoli var. fuscans]ATS74352.1 hypothetical protein XcfCFBP6166P_23295 [Xanthomonas citri pv. phaseoli var. fuscans]ATS78567.1 hypothetical protein XcfCFBP6975P_23495 [Xanthomonas citri pv. phaseoli var. fuscans]KGP22445.1 hypothetical protein NY65_19600 [Xanthomonas phaseoli pv. phaseoli]KGP22818.1 hypothetical protein NY67_18830 [Xanthomonas citri pv. fuscans]
MDRRKYIADLVEKTGVRVDEDDPIFSVVLLNQFILQDQKTELEVLVGRLVKVAGTIQGEVIKQVEERCNARLRELQAEAAELKTNLQREHASYREATKEALRQEVGGTIGRAAEAMQDARRSIMGPVWLAAMVGGVMGGAIGAVAVWLAAGGMQ